MESIPGAPRLGSFTHDYDRASGAERFLLSLNLVSLMMLGVASVLAVRVVRTLRRRQEQ